MTKNSMWIGLAFLCSIAASAAAETAEQWEKARRENVKLLLDCYQKQSLRSIEDRLPLEDHGQIVIRVCRKWINIASDTFFGELRANGNSYELSKNKTAELISSIHVESLRIYKRLIDLRERQIRERRVP